MSQCPFTEGRVQNWDHMSALWEHVFTKELGIKPEDNDCHLIITETIMATQGHK